MRLDTHLLVAAMILAPVAATAQSGEVRGVISCGTGRQIVYFAQGLNDPVTRVLVDGQAVTLPPGERIMVSEVEVYCEPGDPGKALANLRANAAANALPRIPDTAPPVTTAPPADSTAPTTLRPNPLKTPGLPMMSPDQLAARLPLSEAERRKRNENAISMAWNEGGVMGLLYLAHKSWFLYWVIGALTLHFGLRAVADRKGKR